jgi:hypothetical protein
MSSISSSNTNWFIIGTGSFKSSNISYRHNTSSVSQKCSLFLVSGSNGCLSISNATIDQLESVVLATNLFVFTSGDLFELINVTITQLKFNASTHGIINFNGQHLYVNNSVISKISYSRNGNTSMFVYTTGSNVLDIYINQTRFESLGVNVSKDNGQIFGFRGTGYTVTLGFCYFSNLILSNNPGIITSDSILKLNLTRVEFNHISYVLIIKFFYFYLGVG